LTAEQEITINASRRKGNGTATDSKYGYD